jgi:hypothetical protein
MDEWTIHLGKVGLLCSPLYQTNRSSETFAYLATPAVSTQDTLTMNITLINTNGDFWCIGIRKLGGHLRALGHRVRIVSVLRSSGSSFVDLVLHRTHHPQDFSTPQSRSMLNEFLKGEDIVGISSMSVNFCLRTARSIIDNIDVKTVVIMGGFHAMSNPEHAIGMNVDFVCTGEGERPMEALIASMEKDGNPSPEIPGMWHKARSTGQITRNSKGDVIMDVDSTAFPVFGFDDIYICEHGVFRQANDNDYRKHYGNGMRIVSSYGCPFICAYCQSSHGLEGGRVRFHSPEYIVSMIEYIHNIHPFFESVVFYDDSFFSANIERINSLSRLYEQRIGLPFVVGGVMPNLLTDEKLTPLVKAGLSKIYMGLQSGSERLLVDYYKRKTPIRNIARALSLAHAHPKLCIPNLDIIVGNPAESEQDRRETIQTLLSLPRPYSITIFHLMHISNTVLTNTLLSQGLIRDSDIDQAESCIPPNPGTYEIVISLLSISRIPARLIWLIYDNVKLHSKILYQAIYLWGMFKVVVATIVRGYNAQLPYTLSQGAKWFNPAIRRRIEAAPIKQRESASSHRNDVPVGRPDKLIP